MFDCVDHNKLWKILKEMGILDHLTCLLRNQDRKKQSELDMEQQAGSKQEREYVKAVYFHPTYLTYTQSTSWEMLGWMKHKLESRLPGEILRHTDTTLVAESEEELNSLLMKGKEESEEAGLKLNIQKMNMAFWSHHFMANR